MMSLGITAWVTSRKWTLGPSYVNNSRVIETLPSPVTGQCSPVTPGPCDRASVTTWPLPETRETEIGCDGHTDTRTRDHQSSAETQLRFFVTIILDIMNVYWSDVGLERQRTNRGGECAAICDIGQWVRAWSLIQMTTDHRHWGQRGRGGGTCCDKLWRIFRWLWIASIQHIVNSDISQPPPMTTGNCLYGTNVTGGQQKLNC